MLHGGSKTLPMKQYLMTLPTEGSLAQLSIPSSDLPPHVSHINDNIRPLASYSTVSSGGDVRGRMVRGLDANSAKVIRGPKSIIGRYTHGGRV